MQGIVLAGGMGTRLRPVIGDLPKAMAPVRSRPFLAYLLDCLAARGCDRVILAIGYLGTQIKAYFGLRYGKLALCYSEETEPLGTGGALRQALASVEREQAVVVNGDTILSVDFADMLMRHRAQGGPVSVAVREVPQATRYGCIEVDASGRIEVFREKGVDGPGLINAGAYVFDRNIFEAYPLPPRFSLESDFLQPLAHQLRPLAYLTAGAFIDIGVPEDYASAQTLPLTC